MKRNYWHRFSLAKQRNIFRSGTPLGKFIKRFLQPGWCAYPDALMGSLGCWSLTGGNIKSIKDCKGCEHCTQKGPQ